MLIQSIHEETMEAALAAAGAVHPRADAIEFRVDPMPECDAAALVRRSPRPAIVTCRSRAQGGAFRGDPAERRRRLRAAIAAGAAWIDLEFATADEEMIGERGECGVILSAHPPIASPETPMELYRSMAGRAGVDVLKIVPFADSIADNLPLRNLLRLAGRDGRRLAAFCLGERGAVSRILAPAWGSWATYGATRRGREAAAGQLPVAELADLYRVGTIGRDTRLFGILGHPIGHSLSPVVHNRGLQAAKIDARYLPFETRHLAEFLPLLGELPISGLSVTLPHKEGILAHLDEIEEEARAAGSVNTVLRRWNRYLGSNTDIPAAMGVIEAATPVGGRRVVLLGAGGAARALAHALHRRGARLAIYNRTAERARRLAEEVGAEWGALSDFPGERCDLLINATAAGMHPDTEAIPVPAGSIRAATVFDLVYRPAETRLLREARRRGARVIGGLEMFLAQAAEQFRLFTGRPAPAAEMRRAATGTPGAGGPGEGEDA